MSVMSSTRREYRMILITYLLSFSFGRLNEISYSGTLSLHLSQIFPNIFSSVPTLYQRAYWNWVQPAFVAATFQVKFFSIKRNAWKLPTYPHGQMKQIGAMFALLQVCSFDTMAMTLFIEVCRTKDSTLKLFAWTVDHLWKRWQYPMLYRLVLVGYRNFVGKKLVVSIC